MCILVSRLFRVSSPAYPNLLGTKGYVVVVVVVLMVDETAESFKWVFEICGAYGGGG
jgi:hypothetical protein